MAIVGVIGEGISPNEQTFLIYGYLGIVILLKARMGGTFHNARFWVAEVVLVAITWPCCRRGWWAAAWAASRPAFSLLALRQFRFILRLLGCLSLLCAGFQDR